MPTETWNNESRKSRLKGKLGVATSAKGKNRGSILIHVLAILDNLIMIFFATPSVATYKNHSIPN